MIDWATTKAAVFRPRMETLKPILALDEVRLEDLIGIERQKGELTANAERFVRGEFSNHVLLWGSRGTGKSTLIKALLNAYAPQGLRVIEFFKEDLRYLPETVDVIRDLPYRFVVFLDDLAFQGTDATYAYLKSVMEGSIESAPENVRIYATSNRRHLVPEYQSDNNGAEVRDGEIHYGDAVEEKISLADRFGLWISFYQGGEADYLKIVEYYFRNETVDLPTLHLEAKRFAATRASRSGRTAKQFYCSFKARGF